MTDDNTDSTDKIEMPPDPISEIMGGFVALHQMFLESINAGFTEDQAMKLIVGIITTKQEES